jgi:imidazoleglycerol-phosphate dehydratase
MADPRVADISRKTNETDIKLRLYLDGVGQSKINTGIPFFDHMLDLFARHGLFDLEVEAVGDLSVDYHHTVEDVGLVLGQAVAQAIGSKAGLQRYGFFILPMDEVLVRVAMDLSGRPLLDYRAPVGAERIRDFNLSLLREFFQAFANEAGANLHIKLEAGTEPHHVAEGIFKCFARALDMATVIDSRRGQQVPSTKGTLV